MLVMRPVELKETVDSTYVVGARVYAEPSSKDNTSNETKERRKGIRDYKGDGNGQEVNKGRGEAIKDHKHAED